MKGLQYFGDHFLYFLHKNICCGSHLYAFNEGNNISFHLEIRKIIIDYNSPSGLEKSLVLPVLDRFLKLKTSLFLGKKLKNGSIKLCISQNSAIHRLTLSPVRIVHT